MTDNRDAMERAIAVFKRKVLVSDGDCLLYPMRPDAHGYGQINTEKGVVKAHRVAWEIAHGPIGGSDTYIDHRCRNPLCCKVDHLRLATPGENLQNRNGAAKHSKTGLRGVVPTHGRFQAVVTVNGRSYRSDYYDTAEEAAALAAAMRRELMPYSEMDLTGREVMPSNGREDFA